MKYNPSKALAKARELLKKEEEAIEETRKLIRRLEMETAWPELIDSEGISLAGVDGNEWWLMDVGEKELVRVRVALSPDSMLQEYMSHRKDDLCRAAKREFYRRKNVERRRKEENNE